MPASISAKAVMKPSHAADYSSPAGKRSCGTFEGELVAFVMLTLRLRRPISLASLFAAPRLASLVQDARPVEGEAWPVQDVVRLM